MMLPELILTSTVLNVHNNFKIVVDVDILVNLFTPDFNRTHKRGIKQYLYTHTNKNL